MIIYIQVTVDMSDTMTRKIADVQVCHLGPDFPSLYSLSSFYTNASTHHKEKKEKKKKAVDSYQTTSPSPTHSAHREHNTSTSTYVALYIYLRSIPYKTPVVSNKLVDQFIQTGCGVTWYPALECRLG